MRTSELRKASEADQALGSLQPPFALSDEGANALGGPQRDGLVIFEPLDQARILYRGLPEIDRPHPALDEKGANFGKQVIVRHALTIRVL